MKKVLNKLVFVTIILGGIIYLNNNQEPSNEFSEIVLKNLTVLNTASAFQEDDNDDDESKPRKWQTVDCTSGGHWVCMAEKPNTSCTGTDCD